MSRPDQPVRHSRFSNWLAGHLGYPDLFKANAELLQISEQVRERNGMLAALTDGLSRQNSRLNEEISRQEVEIARLHNELEDCNRRLAESEEGSEQLAPTKE